MAAHRRFRHRALDWPHDDGDAAGATGDPVELLDWCTPRMSYFAVPRFVEAVTGELAKTPTGKLQKTPLREAGVTAATWNRDSVGYVVRR